MYKELFSPIRVGKLKLKNRILFPPIATNLAAVTGEVTSEFIHHYSRRAKGGASLITLENICIQFPDARHGATQPRIDNDSFIPGLSRVAHEVHRYGAYIFCELTHPGAMSNIKLAQGKQPVAPSAIDLRPDHTVPKELTEKEIEEIVEMFAQAALRAKKAHFDGVEIEAAHGLLVNQFLSTYSNKRTDKFGGALENRVRFAKLIIDRIHELCGRDFPVTTRLGVRDNVKGGMDLEEAAEVAKALESIGYAAIHGDAGFGPLEERLEPMQYPEAWRVELAEVLKKEGVKVPVVAVGMIRKPETAEEILSSGKADMIGLGRALFADPDWPAKAQAGRERAIRKCIGCSECILARHHEGSATRCGFNPTVGRLESDEILIPVLNPKKVLIVGAGPGGLEAAVTLKKRGHEVTVWDKENTIGGNLRLGDVPPGKEKLKWMIDYYDYMINELGIDLELNKEASLDSIKAFHPDTIIFATGSEPIVPPVKGITGNNSINYTEVLGEKHRDITGKKVVVGGGGLVGCETALLLAKNNDVSIIEMLPELAMGMEPLSRGYLLRELNESGVSVYVNSTVKEVEEDKVVIREFEHEKSISYDIFVVAFGGKPNRKLYETLDGGYEKYFIGDAFGVAKIIDAVQSGYAIGRMI